MAPIEFICLLQLAVVAIVMALIPVIGKIQTWGIRRVVGHPTPGDAPLPAWVQRAERAYLNLIENLVPFAILVAGTMFGVSNETTQTGAEVFVVARLVQGTVHILGIPWIRTIAFFVGLGAMIAMLAEMGVPHLPTLFLH
ncbi:MAG: MAPEG family protein [Alphaproteobacteria bacterium]|nr:MAPEG family protein [Alphaproteobacteria bacterium]